MENPRRRIRVDTTPPTQPAMPPTGGGGVATQASVSGERWAQQVRMAALAAACAKGGLSVLATASKYERYILTGETENPEESQT